MCKPCSKASATPISPFQIAGVNSSPPLVIFDLDQPSPKIHVSKCAPCESQISNYINRPYQKVNGWIIKKPIVVGVWAIDANNTSKDHVSKFRCQSSANSAAKSAAKSGFESAEMTPKALR